MYDFYAYMARMKLIRRWSLMRSVQPENDAEHSLQVAMIAHALALIGRERYGREVSPERAALLAVYHDATEVLTGDLPTPVKYHSPGLRDAYRRIEDDAAGRLLRALPEDFRKEMAPLLAGGDGPEAALVKAADRISAYVKCLEEQQAGNREFDEAARTIRESIDRMELPEAADFMAEFVPAFRLTLDEIGRGGSTEPHDEKRNGGA